MVRDVCGGHRLLKHRVHGTLDEAGVRQTLAVAMGSELRVDDGFEVDACVGRTLFALVSLLDAASAAILAGVRRAHGLTAHGAERPALQAFDAIEAEAHLLARVQARQHLDVAVDLTLPVLG